MSFSLVFLPHLTSQNIDATESIERIIFDLYEHLPENEGEQEQFVDFYDDLIAIAQQPINLNTAMREDLEKLVFLSDVQIENILFHRYQYGEFHSLFELQLIEGFAPYEVRNLSTFVCVGDTYLSERKFYWRDILHYGKHDIHLRLDRALETPNGYLSNYDADEEYNGEHNTPAYRGDPYYTYAKYRFTYSDKLCVGLTAEKDAGEAFAWDEYAKGYDFYGLYMQINDLWKFKTIVLGDYRANFGQGLVMCTDFAMGKSSYVLTVPRHNNGLKKHSSTSEYGFFRGLGATVELSDFDLTAFYSKRRVDANVRDGCFTALSETGLHRTTNELNNKGAVGQQVLGANVNYTYKNLHLGLTTVHTWFSDSLKPAERLYNVHYLRGKRHLVGGLNYRFRLNRLHVFGETAMTEHLGIATLNGLSFTPISILSIVALHRYYSPKFDNMFAEAFSESSHISNEHGLYLGAELSPWAKWKFSLYADAYRFAIPHYGIDAPSAGFDYLVQSNYAPDGWIDMQWRAKWERKGDNIYSDSEPTYEVGLLDKASLRYILNYRYGQFTFRTCLEGNLAKQTDAPFSFGALLAQDFTYQLVRIPLRIDLRLQFFDASEYDNRFYTYERDVLYAFAIPMYYGLGARYYLNIRYDVNKYLCVWLKMAQTVYADGRSSIGSGAAEILGDRKTTLRLMLRCKF